MSVQLYDLVVFDVQFKDHRRSASYECSTCCHRANVTDNGIFIISASVGAGEWHNITDVCLHHSFSVIYIKLCCTRIVHRQFQKLIVVYSNA